MAEKNDLLFSAASPHNNATIKIGKALLNNCILSVPMKYQPEKCNSTNNMEVIVFAVINDIFCRRADNTDPRIKNSSKTGAIITTSKKDGNDV